MVGSYSRDGKGRFKLTVDCADCPHVLPEQLQLVPAAARAGGANGTFWRTDLVLANPGEESVEAQLAFLVPGRDNSTAQEFAVPVPAGGSVELDDVVGTLMGASGSGAIRIRSQGELLVSSRTYTDSEAGTFGQYIPGVPQEKGLAEGGQLRLLGLSENAAYRTNVGLVNTTGEPVTATIDLVDGSGAGLGTTTVTLQPFGWKQINRILGTEGSDAVDTAQAIVRTTSGAGAVLPYASVVDNVTGDPVYIPPAVQATAGTDLWVAAAAHADGYNGSQWRTDLTVANTGTGEARVRVQYLAGGDGPPAEAVLSVPENGVTAITDVLATLLGAEGAGALRLSVEAGTVEAVSRTYNQTANGTYGQFIPAARLEEAIGEGETGLLVQLRKDDAFHTNVGFVNLTGAPAEVEVVYTDGDGTELGRWSTVLPAYGFQQENRAIPGNPAGPVSAAVHCLTSGGRILAYGSVVDDTSGDPIFVPARVLD